MHAADAVRTAGGVSAGTPIIAASGLGKAYPGAAPVLSCVDLTIRAGERVALIGPNGAGKSTLLKSLIGLHPNSEGSVTTFGQAFVAAPNRAQRRAIRQRIGFVFQHHGLVRRLSALSNVVHGLLGRTAARPGSWRAWHQSIAPEAIRHDALAALNAVRLSEKADARVDQLSGGQAQRVAIARALVRDPDLLVADEPAASLDPAAGHDVMGQFAALAAERGITLLFTSHDMEHALRYATRVVALKDGRIAFDRPSAAVARTDLDALFANDRVVGDGGAGDAREAAA